MKNEKRTKHHKRDPELEEILGTLEHVLGQAETNAPPELPKDEYPIVFIMGCARSGTTLLCQYLAKVTGFAYPTNLLSRFYYAPYLGSLIQKVLYDLDVKGELLGSLKQENDFTSHLGKTKGPMAPHEFWFFWRRFFNFSETQFLSDEELETVDVAGFYQGLQSICTVHNSPLVLKGAIMNWNIGFLADVFKNAYFIHIKRDVFSNAKSLFNARLEFFGEKEEWYSFKPPEYEMIKSLEPEEQVVAQVIYSNNAIHEGLKVLEQGRHLTVSYDDFCQNPAGVVESLFKLMSLPKPSVKHIKFEPSTAKGFMSEEEKKIMTFSAKYSHLAVS